MNHRLSIYCSRIADGQFFPPVLMANLDVAPCPPVIGHKLKVNNIIVQSLLSTMYTGVPLMTDIT